MRVATFNVGKGGGAYCEPTRAKIHGHSIDLIALQEVDLNPECGLSSQSFWRSCGWFSRLSLSVGGFSRSAIPSRFPLQPVGLGPDVARVASALVEVHRDGSYFKFCFVGFYGHSGQCADAAAVLETVCHFATWHALCFGRRLPVSFSLGKRRSRAPLLVVCFVSSMIAVEGLFLVHALAGLGLSTIRWHRPFFLPLVL